MSDPGWGMDPEKWLILCWGGRWIVHPPVGEGNPTDHDTFEDARTHFIAAVREHLALARANVDKRWLEHILHWPNPFIQPVKPGDTGGYDDCRDGFDIGAWADLVDWSQWPPKEVPADDSVVPEV